MLTKTEGNVWQAIADAHRIWYRLAEKRLASLGIIPSEYRVLKLLVEEGTSPMVKLAKEQLMTKGGMTGLIDHLEEQGYVERIRSESDRRVINIEITNEGRRLVEKGNVLYQQFLEKSLEDLTGEEIASFLRILNKMISSVQSDGET